MPKFIPQYAFGRGEIAPAFHGRPDLQQFGVSLKVGENGYVLRSGGFVNRPGTRCIGETKNSAVKSRLIPFSFNTEQSYALEFGNGYLRVVKDGGYVVLSSTPTAWAGATPYAVGDHVSNSGTNYYCTTAHTSGTFATDLAAGKWYALSGLIVEIPTPYTTADLPYLKFTQSADVMTLTRWGYGQRELSRLSHTQWVLSTISYSSTLSAPTSLAITASQVGGGSLSAPDGYSSAYYYVLTTVDSDGNESLPCSAVGVLSKTFGYGVGTTAPYQYPNQTLTWTDAASTYQVNIYRKYQGLYALVGTVNAGDQKFVDDNITPDPNQGIPVSSNPFSTDGYPQCSAYYDQRILYGGLASKVAELALSKTGNYHSFYKSEPLKDSDGFTRNLVARKVNEIRHLVPIRELVIFTSGGVWRAGSGSQSDTISPSSFSAKQQNEVGCSHVPPLVIIDRILFVQDMGCVVRDMGYNYAKDNYDGEDISLFSSHMLEGHEIVDWAHAPIPNSIIYAVREDGVLLTLTYLKEQEMAAWTRNITDGEYESVCTIPEGSETAVYVIVKRTINGSTKRFVERFASRIIKDSTDAFFVDCGLTYDGAVAATLTPGAGATTAGTTGVTFTAGSSSFASGDVGRYIFHHYEEDGVYYTAKALITGYTSGTVVTGTIINAFPSTDAIASEGWALTVTTISGLDHLEGKTVAILADGAVLPQQVIASGAITLPVASSVVHVGLPYETTGETLPLGDQQGGIGLRKKAVKVRARLAYSRGLWAGPSADLLTELKRRSWDTALLTEEVQIGIIPAYNETATVVFKQVDPLPMTMLCLIPEVEA